MDSRKLSRTALWAISVLLASCCRCPGPERPGGRHRDDRQWGRFVAVVFRDDGRPVAGAGCGDVGFGQSCCPRWTASAEFIILERIGTANQTLVTTYPGAPNPATQFIVGQGTDRLYSGDLTQGFAGGPKIGLT